MLIKDDVYALPIGLGSIYLNYMCFIFMANAIKYTMQYMYPIWVLHAPPSSSHGTSTQLQGLDFWVEPQGGHIADEDQDRVKRTKKTKGGGSGKREIPVKQ